MPKFKDLFRFKKKEVDLAFKNARITNKIHGLTLLQKMEVGGNPGKLLIVISKKVGKSNIRNF